MNSNKIKKQWSLRKMDFDPSVVDFAIDKFKLSRVAASLVCDRAGNSNQAVSDFICCDACEPIDPMKLKDMDKAVARIIKAIESGDEVVAIYGDYDVDGVTSVSMMYLYLTSLGLRTGYYIPSRNDEGYGVNREAIRKLHSKGVTLIITVDTGITAIEEIEYAKRLGIDIIVTDHHECRPILPDAVAVVDPHRSDCNFPFKELAGVGVAYKLICAVEVARCAVTGKTEYEAQRDVLLKYGDLVAIGTVADVMPIIGENRAIVSMGLKIIDARPRLGIEALIDAASGKSAYGAQKKDITATYIGFTIAPRLNAAGRMGNAAVAVELLLADNKETAANIATELCETNRLRQTEENKIVDSALEKIEEEWDLHLKGNGVVVLDGEDWQHGVIGIVASRVTERYGLPSILISFEGCVPAFSEPSPIDLGKGSGRSIKGFNLVAALSECSDLLEKYGGHELAAGLSLRRGNLDEFRKRINEYAKPILDNLERVQVIEADMEVSTDDLSIEFAKEVTQIIEPCGPMNSTPSFIMKDVVVNSVRGIGAGKHIKLTFESGKRKFTGLWFGVSEAETCFKSGDLVDILFTVGINTFNGNTELQLIITDMRYAESVYQRRIMEREKLRNILGGASFSVNDNALPERSDFVALYKLFITQVKNGRYSVADSSAAKLFSASLPVDLVPNFVKYRLMLEVFNELDIFKVECLPLVSDENGDRWQLPEDICVITRGGAERVNLEDSEILAKLRLRMTK